jgi:tRNA (Thr-GGU) A37 N-methylase
MSNYTFSIPESQLHVLETFIAEGHSKVMEKQKRQLKYLLTEENVTLEEAYRKSVEEADNPKFYWVYSYVSNHAKGKPWYGCSSDENGILTYQFIPNGIGCTVTVTNNITKETIDLSAIDEW